MYEPDEQDEIIGDAMAVGGPAFVEELHWAAMDAAETACPWDGNGTEPVAYRRAWMAAARGLVAQRRARLDGDTAAPGNDDAASQRSAADRTRTDRN